MAILRLLEFLALAMMIVIGSIVIVNLDLVESILADASINRGEFHTAIVILPLLFLTVAFVLSKK